jgi:hypothetical protein
VEVRGLNEQFDELRRRGSAKRQQINDAQQELVDLDSQAGQQVNKLKQVSPDAARAWDWIQKNMDQFEKPVFGPPMIECSVKDPRYTDMLEGLFQKGDLMSITAQTRADFKKLSDQVYGTMNLADVNIKTQSRSLLEELQKRPNISEEQMQQFGLDGWASDFLEGPEPVIAMLCSASNLHSVGIALEDVSEVQYNQILQGRIGGWASGKHTYRTQRRAEYGPDATSTTTKNVRPAQLWTDRPVDLSAKREVEGRIQTLVEEFEVMKEESRPLKEKRDALQIEQRPIKDEIVGLPRGNPTKPSLTFGTDQS